MRTLFSRNAQRSGAPAQADAPLPDPAAVRTRYRSEPGMIGHYPWSYADEKARGASRPEFETENLYSEPQVRALLAVERERLQHPTQEMEIAGMRALRKTYRTVTGAESRQQARACWDAMVAAMAAFR